jgi:hypothetical protein
VRGPETYEPLPSEAFRTDADRSEARTARQGHDHVAVDSSKTGGLLKAAASGLYRVTESLENLFAYVLLRRRCNRTKTQPRSYGFELSVPVLGCFLNSTETRVARITEHCN